MCLLFIFWLRLWLCYIGIVYIDLLVLRLLVRIIDVVYRGYCSGGVGLCGLYGIGGKGYILYWVFLDLCDYYFFIVVYGFFCFKFV